MTPRRVIQAASFVIFLVLLWYAAFPLVLPVPVDLFLRMDPLILIATIITTRGFIAVLLPGVVVVLLTIICGRFFCSMVCPLGTSIDISDRLIRGSKAAERKRTSHKEKGKLIKYLALCFILAAALLRISLAAYGAPISIITRFYALLVYPIFTIIADAGFTIVRPIAAKAGITSLAYADLVTPVFAL
jgi:polyferredoxin